MYRFLVVALASMICVWGGSAHALERCSVGQRVKAPAGLGTVVAIQNGGVGCTVQIDGRPSTIQDTYGAFMLDPVAAPPQPNGSNRQNGSAPTPATARPGAYQCYGGPAGNMTFVVLSGGRYAGAQGTSGQMRMTGPHKDRPAWRTFALVGGPLDGFYGALMNDGRIGLTSQANASFYNMTCDVPSAGRSR
jgi:hypothetical protein